MSSAAATIRELLRLAELGGADPKWLASASDELVALILAADPRKLHTAALARRVRAADRALRDAGTEDRIEALKHRFGIGRSRIYALLSQSCEPVDTFVL